MILKSPSTGGSGPIPVASTTDSTASKSAQALLIKKSRKAATSNSILPSRNDLRSYRAEANPVRSAKEFKKLCLSIPKLVRHFIGETFYIPMYRREWHEEMGMQPKSTRTALLKREQVAAKERYILMLNTMELSPAGFPHDHHNCVRIKINVSGRIFETQRRTLRRYPDTLLGNERRMVPFYDSKQGYYYFDRSRESFEAILYYYQSGGRLRRPINTSLETLYGDITFYDLGEDVLFIFREDEGVTFDGDNKAPTSMLKRKIWLLFEFPESSVHAAIVSILSIITVIISIMAFVSETMPMFREVQHQSILYTPRFHDVFFLVETICVVWFCLEYFFRFIASPKIGKFLFDWMNFIDVISVLPYFLQVITDEVNPNKKSKNQTTYLTALRTIRLVRVFRIFKLSRHSKGLQILGLTLKASMRELGLLIFFLGIGVILFSSAIYFAELELGPDSDYGSIPETFYWSIVTMTTVGYGDLTPSTVLGKLIGSLCAVAGVLTIALPVPVIVSNFNYFYNLSTDEKRIESNLINIQHVQMCPFLSTGGVFPHLERAKQQYTQVPKKSSGDIINETTQIREQNKMGANTSK